MTYLQNLTIAMACLQLIKKLKGQKANGERIVAQEGGVELGLFRISN